MLVHGLPGSAYDWAPLTDALAARGFRVIAYDRMGYGYSDARADGDFTIAANARDLLGLLENQDLSHLLEYCQLAAKAVGWDVPINYPLVGDDAFRTATGVHAAAIIKAKQKGDDWLADRIYSGVPAGMFGRQQEICIGYMSGASNVNYWLRQRDIEPNEELVKRILARAKESKHILRDEEVMDLVRQQPKS